MTFNVGDTVRAVETFTHPENDSHSLAGVTRITKGKTYTVKAVYENEKTVCIEQDDTDIRGVFFKMGHFEKVEPVHPWKNVSEAGRAGDRRELWDQGFDAIVDYLDATAPEATLADGWYVVKVYDAQRVLYSEKGAWYHLLNSDGKPFDPSYVNDITVIKPLS